jgi:ribosomal protein L31
MAPDSPVLDKIATAYGLVASGVSQRIDGDGFKVYSMGGTGLVRIDIDPAKHPELTNGKGS